MQNVIWVLLLIVVVFFIVRRMIPVSGVTSIGSEELQNRLQIKGPNRPEFIDVREPHEYQSGHVPNFRNVPLGRIKREADVLSKDKEIVVMCRSGARSMQAAKILKKQGFSKVTNVSGGIMAWSGKTVK
ncbi:MAG: rhodanese-like domain-containing protein [Alicyclobacillus sp.]|nr:rhodanese-like domain-containing protein [Alicyclobacillus sp.]